MVEVTRHYSLSSLDKYDESLALQVQATQLAYQMPYDVNVTSESQHQHFEYFKEVVTSQYYKNQVRDMDASTSSNVSLLPNNVAHINPTAVSKTMGVNASVPGHVNSLIAQDRSIFFIIRVISLMIDLRFKCAFHKLSFPHLSKNLRNVRFYIYCIKICSKYIFNIIHG